MTTTSLPQEQWLDHFDNALLVKDSEDSVYFLEWCVQNHSHENVLFYWAVNEYRALAKTLDNQDVINRMAQALSKSYIQPGSHCEANIDNTTRKKVLKSIDDMEIDFEIFDLAQKKIYNLLKTDCLTRYMLIRDKFILQENFKKDDEKKKSKKRKRSTWSGASVKHATKGANQKAAFTASDLEHSHNKDLKDVEDLNIKSSGRMNNNYNTLRKKLNKRKSEEPPFKGSLGSCSNESLHETEKSGVLFSTDDCEDFSDSKNNSNFNHERDRDRGALSDSGEYFTYDNSDSENDSFSVVPVRTKNKRAKQKVNNNNSNSNGINNNGSGNDTELPTVPLEQESDLDSCIEEKPRKRRNSKGTLKRKISIKRGTLKKIPTNFKDDDTSGDELSVLNESTRRRSASLEEIALNDYERQEIESNDKKVPNEGNNGDDAEDRKKNSKVKEFSTLLRRKSQKGLTLARDFNSFSTDNVHELNSNDCHDNPGDGDELSDDNENGALEVDEARQRTRSCNPTYLTQSDSRKKSSPGSMIKRHLSTKRDRMAGKPDISSFSTSAINDGSDNACTRKTPKSATRKSTPNLLNSEDISGPVRFSTENLSNKWTSRNLIDISSLDATNQEIIKQLEMQSDEISSDHKTQIISQSTPTSPSTNIRTMRRRPPPGIPAPYAGKKQFNNNNSNDSITSNKCENENTNEFNFNVQVDTLEVSLINALDGLLSDIDSKGDIMKVT